jgi:hypothetical protein
VAGGAGTRRRASWRRGRVACLAALLLIISGCSNGSEPSAEGPRRPRDRKSSPAAPTETISPGVQETPGESTPVPTAGPALTTQAFQMPSGNIFCLHLGRDVRCDILSGLNPEPALQCDVDWTGITLGEESAQPQCAGDTILNPEAPVLPYGSTWARGGITCESQTTGLSCSNERGSGFSLARAGWEIHN